MTIATLFFLGYLFEITIGALTNRRLKRYKKEDYDKALYDNHINSKEWRITRLTRLELDNYRCVSCGRYVKEKFNCHHLTYKRLGKEKLKDVVTLCVPCHQKEHGK